MNVSVIARFSEIGEVMPLSIIMEDGRKFEIDRTSKPIRKASLKAGGIGLRYQIHVKGQERFLFREDDVWFVET